MISNGDLERLIAEKKREIEKEKIVLGLSTSGDLCQLVNAEDDKENVGRRTKKSVTIESEAASHHDDSQEDQKEAPELPADLERYIRRYLGLPVMLKAGEYSPNNPLIRSTRQAGDVLLGLGEYERRRNTLRKLQQKQYREFLDQQAKLKQEAKQQAERERLEREEKERKREEERERARRQIEEEKERARRQIEEDKERARRDEPRRASVCYVPEGRSLVQGNVTRKVDTAVQVGISRPLSVAVQTDNAELYRLSPSPSKFQLTQAERELSPRTVVDNDERPIKPSPWAKNNWDRTENGEKLARNSWDSNQDGEKPARNSWDRNQDGEKPARSSWDRNQDGEKDVKANWDRNQEADKQLETNWDRNQDNEKQTRNSWDRTQDGEKQTNTSLAQKDSDKSRIEFGNGDIATKRNYKKQKSKFEHENDLESDKTWGNCEKQVRSSWGDVGVNSDREQNAVRRRSYGDFDERPLVRKTSRDRLWSDLRHSYMPSIFDADAIQMRNLQAEKEATERRQFYQQELKNQIQEQQRIREERKTREKTLELAEMRRLEEQLRMLRVAQERESHTQSDITNAMKENAMEFENKRTTLQREIDYEQQKLRPKRHSTALSDTEKLPHFSFDPSKIPHFTPRGTKLPHFTPREEKRPPYSTNIPDSSIFSPNYDVDGYLRKNLNPTKETLMNLDFNRDNLNLRDKTDLIGDETDLSRNKNNLHRDKMDRNNENVIVERAQIHERPKEKRPTERRFFQNRDEFSQKRDEISHKRDEIIDDTPIPVLRHSPKSSLSTNEPIEGMKLVENKWKVPAVQKNILKSLPNEEGKNLSILTQLGSIRRQLQLEQLRLDNMTAKSD